MEIQYTVTLDDLMRFAEHVYRTSPSIRRRRIARHILMPLFFAGWAGAYYWETRTLDWLFILLLVPAIAAALFIPAIYDRPALKDLYKQFIVRPDKSDAGPLRLIVDRDGITEIAASRESRRPWTEILRIEETDDYLYLFESPDGAFIVPRRSFSELRTYEDFKKQMAEYAQGRTVG